MTLNELIICVILGDKTLLKQIYMFQSLIESYFMRGLVFQLL